MPDFEQRLQELFLELPVPIAKKSVGPVVAAQVGNGFIWCSQALPVSAGRISFKGRLGLEVTLEQGRQAAQHALLNGLGALREKLGTLNSIRQIVQLGGLAASSGSFHDFDAVFEPASKLLFDIFGSAGRHTRVLSGVQQLPQGACLSLSLIAAVKP